MRLALTFYSRFCVLRHARRRRAVVACMVFIGLVYGASIGMARAARPALLVASSYGGPNDGSSNDLTSASPTGGNYIAADGALQVRPIAQTISGLNAGQTVAVSFVWARAQKSGFDGCTTDFWSVGLGSSPSQSSNTVSLPNHGFSGWMNQTFCFIATSSSEALLFLATGTPSGVPPFALLANVSVTNVLEPASVMVILSEIVRIAGFARRRGSRIPNKSAE